jgi:hypothetical protein
MWWATTGDTARRRRLAPAMLVGLVAAGHPAGATVVLQAVAAVEPHDPPTVHLVVSNTGTETARDVVPQLLYQHRTYDGERAQLEPTIRRAWRFSLAPPDGVGTFPATLRLRWSDPDAGASSLALVVLVTTPGAVESRLAATWVVEPITRLGHARLQLENPGAVPVAGRVVFVLPEHLTTEPESEPAAVPAGGRTTVPLVIENQGAPPGRSYSISAVFTYTENGTHHAVLAETTAPVVVGSGEDRIPPLAIGAGALAVALGLLAVAWRAAGRRGATLS